MTRYADLPSGRSWGMWGARDRCGALNRLTPQRVLQAQRWVRSGEVVSLDIDAGEIDPPLFGRRAPSREIRALGPEEAAFDEVLSGWNAQAGSQWDGFGHVAEPGVGSYNGLSRDEHGTAYWARHGVVGRGLLVDLPRWWSEQGVERDPLRYGAVTPDEVRTALAAQASVPLPGDLLLVRTGWLTAYRRLDAAGRAALAAGAGDSLGLVATPEMSALLWDLEVAAVAADNPSLEAWPPGRAGAVPPGAPASLHRSLLARLGVPIGELWDLDTLAERCAARGGYEFLCVSVPLALDRALASPASAVAIL